MCAGAERETATGGSDVECGGGEHLGVESSESIESNPGGSLRGLVRTSYVLRWNENEADEVGHPLCPPNGQRYGMSRAELPQVNLCVLSIGCRSER